jgi:hypothetical protein
MIFLPEAQVGQVTFSKVLFGRHLRRRVDDMKLSVNLLNPPAAQLFQNIKKIVLQ